ncbi:MAG: DNA repair protein RadA [Candidatus Kerfeldbacteria bacterium]|nr:DNA repair protein RadA [Candidatus Kerfeldbacteria bacterium]
MAKDQRVFICSNCDSQFAKWQGRCQECGQWGTLSEGRPPTEDRRKVTGRPGKAVAFADVTVERAERVTTGLNELDRVLGGGIVPGSLILLGGDPGIGKSTLVLQLAVALAAQGEVLYVSGEESAEQVKMRLQRLTPHGGKIRFLGETNVETIVATIDRDRPQLVVVDSIQTMYWPNIPSEAGSINQVRASTVKFLEAAKRGQSAIILIGHVTKEGLVAGPKTLEHLVDTVLYLEGDQYHAFRILRSVKNRFGSTNEVGVFDMRDSGLVEVKNPSQVFLAERQAGPGSCVTAVMEGTRPFLVEIQALVNPTVFGMPRRTGSGIEFNRLQLLLAVLSKRVGLKLAAQDVFVNVVGGFRVSEPAVDLAVCLAVASAALNKAVPKDLVAIGEVGLAGEVRSVSQLEQRLKEAEKLGFQHAVVATAKPIKAKIDLLQVRTMAEAVKEVLGR